MLYPIFCQSNSYISTNFKINKAKPNLTHQCGGSKIPKRKRAFALYYDKALVLNPNDEDALYNKGLVLFR